MLLLLLVEDIKYVFDVHPSSITFMQIFVKIGQNFSELKRGKQEQSGDIFPFMITKRGKIYLAEREREREQFRLFAYSVGHERSLIALFSYKCTVQLTPVLHCSVLNAHLHSNLNSAHVDPRDVGRQALPLPYCNNIFDLYRVLNSRHEGHIRPTCLFITYLSDRFNYRFLFL